MIFCARTVKKALFISLFGGTTPLVMMWLVEKTNHYMAPAYYYMWGAIVCLASLMICERSQRKTFDSQFVTIS